MNYQYPKINKELGQKIEKFNGGVFGYTALRDEQALLSESLEDQISEKGYEEVQNKIDGLTKKLTVTRNLLKQDYSSIEELAVKAQKIKDEESSQDQDRVSQQKKEFIENVLQEITPRIEQLAVALGSVSAANKIIEEQLPIKPERIHAKRGSYDVDTIKHLDQKAVETIKQFEFDDIPEPVVGWGVQDYFETVLVELEGS